MHDPILPFLPHSQPSFPPGQPASVVYANPPPPQMNPTPQPRQVGPPKHTTTQPPTRCVGVICSTPEHSCCPTVQKWHLDNLESTSLPLCAALFSVFTDLHFLSRSETWIKRWDWYSQGLYPASVLVCESSPLSQPEVPSVKNPMYFIPVWICMSAWHLLNSCDTL